MGSLTKEIESTEFYNGIICPDVTYYSALMEEDTHVDLLSISPYRQLSSKKELPPIYALIRQGVTIAMPISKSDRGELKDMKCINRYFPLIPIEEIIKWSTINCINRQNQQNDNSGVMLIDKIAWDSMLLTPESTAIKLI